MPWSAHRTLTALRTLLTAAAIGFACGAILGALYVLIGWFPGAMITFAEHPHYADPRLSLLPWCGAYAAVTGLAGLVVGAVIGIFRVVPPPSK